MLALSGRWHRPHRKARRVPQSNPFQGRARLRPPLPTGQRGPGLFALSFHHVVVPSQRGGPMLANAVFVATLLFLALGFWLMHELLFLAPWRGLIFHQYL